MPKPTIVRPVFAVFTLVLLVLAVHTPARADIAPPLQPPGSNITPASVTQVAMAAEHVELTIASAPVPTDRHHSLAGGLTHARVSATFTMTNRGAANERIAVRFPLNTPSGESDGFGRYPDIQGFAASINGRDVLTRVIRNEAFQPKRGDPVINWAVFDVTFLAQQDTIIGVSYTLSATGYSPEAAFNYVLQTGAGWRDAIGEATIVVRLPYTITKANFFVARADWPQPTELRGNEARWVYRNLEPGANSDIQFTVIEPRFWQEILAARAAVDARPGDGERQLELARAYRRAVIFKYEPSAYTAHFVEPTKTHYRLAIRRMPRAAAPRAELATALFLWGFNPLGQAAHADLANMHEIVGLIDAALSLEPGSPAARKTLRDVDAELGRWAVRSSAAQQPRIARLQERVRAVANRAGIPLPPKTPTPEPKG